MLKSQKQKNQVVKRFVDPEKITVAEDVESEENVQGSKRQHSDSGFVTVRRRQKN